MLSTGSARGLGGSHNTTHTAAVRVELTVEHRGHSRDIAVVSAQDCTLADIAGRLAEAAGALPGSALWHGRRMLLPDTALGSSLMRTGNVLAFGAPATAATEPATLSVRQVGGLGAGRIVPLARGTTRIGRSTECAITVADADISRVHAELIVTRNSIEVRDCGSTNGTRIGSRPVSRTAVRAAHDDLIRVGECTFAVGQTAEPAASLLAGGAGTAILLRPPRPEPQRDKVAIDFPATVPAQRHRSV